jgi:hypothetical protein
MSQRKDCFEFGTHGHQRLWPIPQSRQSHISTYGIMAFFRSKFSCWWWIIILFFFSCPVFSQQPKNLLFMAVATRNRLFYLFLIISIFLLINFKITEGCENSSFIFENFLDFNLFFNSVEDSLENIWWRFSDPWSEILEHFNLKCPTSRSG